MYATVQLHECDKIMSILELQAKQQLLDRELAQIQLDLKQRKIDRERRKFQLEDVEDRIFDLTIRDKETDLAIAETRSESKLKTLEQARKEGRYLEGKYALQETSWALELATSEIQIAGARQKIEEMRAASAILQQTIDHRFSAVIGGI
jgi:hypothetical protein